MAEICLLFFPAVGNAEDGEVNDIGDYGNYWSASLNGDNVNNAWNLNFEDGNIEVNNDNRYYGNSVRPVRSQHLPPFVILYHGIYINEKAIAF